MSHDPDDVSNNPYNESGARSSPTPRTSNNWFCHSCQRDFTSNQVLRTPDPTCPYCRSDFVEETGESADDPHEFDRPMFGFPPFLAHPPGQPHTQDPEDHEHEHDEQGQHPHVMFMPQGGGDAGPFGLLMAALTQGMMGPQMQQQQQQARPPTTTTGQQGPPPLQQQAGGSTPAPPQRPLQPWEVAAEAARRRAASHEPDAGTGTGSTPGQSNTTGTAPAATGTQTQQQTSTQGPRSATPFGNTTTYQYGPTTFIWSTSSNRPPPTTAQPAASQPGAPSARGPQGSPQQPPQQQQGHTGPVRNLASFLQEAFSGHGHQTQQQSQQQGGQTQTPQSPLQQGQAQQATGDGHPHASDPLMHMLGGLAHMFGVPVGSQQQQQQNQQQQQPRPAGPGGAQAAGQQGQGPAQPQGARPSGGPTGGAGGGGANFVFTGPGQARVVFTFGGPPSAGGESVIPGFLPFMMGAMGDEGAVPGQMGDYVFSQGALDNIITELMNQAQGRYGPQPAPEDVINNLPTFKMTKDLLSADTVSECAVCKDEFAEEEDVMNHIFHVDCIKPWLERSGTCPICRHQLVPQPEPPRAPGQESAQTPGVDSNSATNTNGAPQSGPASPSLPRSPPITGGSHLPGGFPFGNIFTTLGHFLSGGGSNNSGGSNDGGSGGGGGGGGSTTATATSAATPGVEHASNVARASGDDRARASEEEERRRSQQGQTQTQAQTQSGEAAQGQPDMDLDLD